MHTKIASFLFYDLKNPEQYLKFTQNIWPVIYF